MSEYRMKYAQFEYERRFLLAQLPSDLDQNGDYKVIDDRYIINSNLRLRRMETAVTHNIAYKLGKKMPAPESPHLACIMTNIYLSEAEYHHFINIPALSLHKIRFTYYDNDLRFSIDVFDHLSLILCEIEQPTLEALNRIPLPVFATKEVTSDPQFTGIQLAQR